MPPRSGGARAVGVRGEEYTGRRTPLFPAGYAAHGAELPPVTRQAGSRPQAVLSHDQLQPGPAATRAAQQPPALPGTRRALNNHGPCGCAPATAPLCRLPAAAPPAAAPLRRLSNTTERFSSEVSTPPGGGAARQGTGAWTRWAGTAFRLDTRGGDSPVGADPGRQRRDPVVPQVQPGEVGQQLEEVGGEGAEGVALQVQLLQSRDERRSAAGLGGKRGVHPHMAHGRRGGRRAECQGPALGRGDCPCALTPGGPSHAHSLHKHPPHRARACGFSHCSSAPGPPVFPSDRAARATCGPGTRPEVVAEAHHPGPPPPPHEGSP